MLFLSYRIEEINRHFRPCESGVGPTCTAGMTDRVLPIPSRMASEALFQWPIERPRAVAVAHGVTSFDQEFGFVWTGPHSLRPALIRNPTANHLVFSVGSYRQRHWRRHSCVTTTALVVALSCPRPFHPLPLPPWTKNLRRFCIQVYTSDHNSYGSRDATQHNVDKTYKEFWRDMASRNLIFIFS